jgi:hypothetical protein
MKKLLALLLAMLVIGSVFAGPVRINGPGISEISAERIFEIGDVASADVLTLVIDRRGLNNVQFRAVGFIRVAGTKFSGDFQGVYINDFIGTTGQLYYFSRSLYACPDSYKFFTGDASQSQEVNSLRGSHKRAGFGTMMI